MRKTLVETLFLFLSGTIFLATAAAQTGTRESLDLPGCPIRDLAAGSDPSSPSFIIVAACESSVGLHFARSFGGNWTFAAGGSYSSGSSRQVEITTGGIFAVANNVLLRTSLPSSATSFTPNWSAVSGLENATEIAAFGKFLLVLRSTGISVYDTAASTILQDVALPVGAVNVASLRVGPSYVYVLGRPTANAPEALFRTPFNSSSGAIDGTWTDLSGATGLAYDSDDDIWNFYVNPVNGDVFTGIRRQPEFTSLMYRSTNNGQSYTSTGVGFVVNAMSFSADGLTIIMGTSASTDGGTTWKTLTRNPGSFDESRGRLEDEASIINQVDATQALVTTNEGVALTSNLAATTPTFTTASTGLEGTQVYVVSPSQNNPNRAVVGSSGGVAVTDTFTSKDVTWTYPICPGNDCVGGRTVFIDPTNDDRLYYGSGNIRRCDLSNISNITCSDFAFKPTNVLSFSVFKMYAALPGFVVAGYVRTEGATDGGLYFYNVGDPSSPTSAAELAGKPVRSFIPLSAQVMFAGAGTDLINNSALRGIYKSTNGGSNFTRLTDADLSDTVLVNAFAYDDTKDILYAATAGQNGNTGTILRLEGALAGSTDWQIPTTSFTNENFSSVTVDVTTGDVFASAGSKIYQSIDGGKTFTVLFTGLTGETTSDLETTTPSTTGSGVSSQATGRRLVQASSIGIFELHANATPPPATPTPNPNTCSLKIIGCNGAVAPSSACTFSVAFKDGTTGKGTVTPFQIQRLAGSTYSNYGRPISTTKKGTRTVAKKAKAGSYRVIFTEKPCTTQTRVIRVKKPGKSH